MFVMLITNRVYISFSVMFDIGFYRIQRWTVKMHAGDILHIFSHSIWGP